MKYINIAICFSFLFLSCSAKNSSDNDVKNVILLIGDGMGTNQVFAGITANQGKLELERAQYVGFSKTASANNYITDSGAGGSAIATGKKANNYTIGLDSAGQVQTNIIELAEHKGLATGLVVTSSITHATPASFIAHVSNRHSEYIIASQFTGSGIDIFIGGGKMFFENGADISNKLRTEGYNIVYSLEDIDATSTNNIGCLAADKSLPKVLDGRGNYLTDATHVALKKLSQNQKGFFLMIEGSQIDWACHDNDYDYLTSEMIDFDKVVGIAFDFADKNPGTLVVVTADHETGGFTYTGNEKNIGGEIKPHFSSEHHSPVMVPVFTYGTGAEKFAGIYENTELFHFITKALKLHEK